VSDVDVSVHAIPTRRLPTPQSQLAPSVHVLQTVSVVAVQAADSYSPAGHVLHVAQVSCVPLTRNLPLSQELHWLSEGLVQVAVEVQPLIWVQVEHVVLLVEVQTCETYVPVPQEPHVLHDA
jgi:hypothetical protein